MELMFNELCVRYDPQRLAMSLDHAQSWLQEFSQLLTLLSKHKNARELRVPIEFGKMELISGYTFGRLLDEKEKLLTNEYRTNIKIFTDRGKYLEDFSIISDDDGLFHHQQNELFFQYKGLIARGFGAAYLLKCLALSIATEADWDSISIEIEQHQNTGKTIVKIDHACKCSHLNIPQRIFDRNPKHDIQYDIAVNDAFISQLDLSDEEAQNILDRAARVDYDKRLYGYSKRTGKFYIFPCHRLGYYHAYPIKVTEIKYRPQVLRQLLDADLIDEETGRRYLKGN